MESTSRELFAIPEEVPLPRDPNAADTPDDYQGLAFIPVAVRDGIRNGSRERLLSVAAQYPDRLHLATDHLASQILVEGGRAVGVRTLTGSGLYDAAPLPATPAGPAREFRARREVIVAGGAFNTPQLLMLSGIGDAGELSARGIDVIADLPGVGRNLHDRYEVSVTFELDRDYPIFSGATLDLPGADETPDVLAAQWLDDKDGPWTTNGTLAAVVARSSVATDASDLIVFALPIDFHGYYPGYSTDAAEHHNRLSILVLKGHTKNRAGRVTLRSANPTDPPEISFRYFEEGDAGWQEDLAGVVDGIAIARAIVERLELAGVTRELLPGSSLADRESLASFVRDQAWGHHACGTARVGSRSDRGAVVDGHLRVHGVDALRIVDASVFPDIPGFFIASSVYLLSERASDLIIEDAQRT